MRSSIKISLVGLAVLALQACAPMAPKTPDKTLEHPEVIHVLTNDMNLVTFQAGKPDIALRTLEVKGLRSGDSIIGMDYRITKKALYAVSRAGQVYTLDTDTGILTPLGSNPHIKLVGEHFGVNFSPADDTIRVVSDKGQNLRFNSETGILAGVDNTLHYSENDIQEANVSNVVATAYTFNPKNPSMTTNFVIDQRLGMLVRQGSLEAREPIVSPNTGWLSTIGPLGTGAIQHATFDISNTNNKAFLVAQKKNDVTSKLYLVDLHLGKAVPLGSLNYGRYIIGLTVVPGKH